MKLIRIHELLDSKAMKDLKKSKQKHSKRVANLTRQLSLSEDVYNAAFYHDYLERVGNHNRLTRVISFRSYTLVNILTHKEDVDTLSDLKKKMKFISKGLREEVIIIKICDKTDNLIKRKQDGELKKKYIYKSADLINYLYRLSENKSQLKSFIKKNLFSEIPKLEKYITF